MEIAIRACQEEGLSVNKAASMFKVPRSTLRRRLAGIPAGKRGCSRKFDADAEHFLAHLMMKAAATGVPFYKPLLARLLAKICIAKGFPEDKCKFTEKWMRSFLKRHPEVSQKVTEASQPNPEQEAEVNHGEKWCKTMSELHMEGYLDNPEGIFLLDAGTFGVQEKSAATGAKKERQNVLTAAADGSDKDSAIVVACGSPSGYISGPLILCNGKTVGGPENDAKDFLTMDNAFAECIAKKISESPAEKITIFVNNCNSIITNDELLFHCMNSDKDTKVVYVPASRKEGSHSQTGEPTSVLSILGSIQHFWKEFMQSKAAIAAAATAAGNQVPEPDFAKELLDKWSRFDLKEYAKHEFQRTGIFPYDPSAIVRTFPPNAVSPLKPAKEKKNASGGTRPLRFSDVYAEQLKEIREILLRIHPLHPTAVNECMSFIVNLGEKGFSSKRPIVTISEGIQLDLNLGGVKNGKAKKKRK